MRFGLYISDVVRNILWFKLCTYICMYVTHKYTDVSVWDALRESICSGRSRSSSKLRISISVTRFFVSMCVS